MGINPVGRGVAMMEVTKGLKQEHQDIQHVIDLMEQMSNRLVSGDSSMVPPLREAVDFVRGFADRCHHDKEEKLLFPALEASGVPRQGGPIGVMLHEHDLGRRYISGVSQGLDDYEAGKEGAADEVAKNVKGYAELLRAHIQKENMVLFPMAEKVLTEPEKADLGEKMEEVEHKLGERVHHEYLHDITDMEEALSK